jgi:serine/threonine-protein kinase
LAGLGEDREAFGEAHWLEMSATYRDDAVQGTWARQHRAMILAQAGDHEAALDEIEWQLSGPSWLTVHLLQLDPRWDPLRDHPRFQALLEKYATDMEL